MNEELISAYAYHKRQPATRARDALDFARVDVAAGKKRYTSMRDVVNASQNDPGAANSSGARYFPDPAACGFRDQGTAHDIAPRAVEHTGWYTDQFYDSLAVGVVFLLPGRDGHARAYPAVRHTGADGDGALIYMREGERVESRREELDRGDFRDVAVRADRLAEIYAENERAYQAAAGAGNQWRENREQSASVCRDLRKLRAALRDLPAGLDVARETIEAAIEDKRDCLRDLCKENAELAAGEWYAGDYSLQFNDCDADMRLAFNESAGRDVLPPLPPRLGARRAA